MICEKLPTITVITKNSTVFEYAIDQRNPISLEELCKYFKEEYKDNLKEIRLGDTIGYIRKPNYEK